VRLNRPVVIRGGIKQQEYYTKWKDDDYMVKKFGDTMVMVEEQKVEDRMGSGIIDMTLRDYIKGYKDNVWYIVQDVFPHMLRDVGMPDVLKCDEFHKGMNMVVMWFSSGGTSSVLHNDEQENLLSIVQGTKHLLLFPPEEAPQLYVHEADRPGLSPITQRSVDMKLFPKFSQATMANVTLHEGDLLYIPRKWWHQVESPQAAGRNLGVNFWWYPGGPLDNRQKTIKAPFSLPRQPENYPEMLRKELLTPDGKYGGYKLKWPETIACKKPFTAKHMAEVKISDHEYLDGLQRHNEHMASLRHQDA